MLSGQLNEMLQELLISNTALKMAGAFAISLETNIDRKDLETAFKGLQVFAIDNEIDLLNQKAAFKDGFLRKV